MTPPRAATPAGRRTSDAKAPRTPAGGSPARTPRPEVRISAKSQDAIAGAARAAVRASAAAASAAPPRPPASRRSAAPSHRASGPVARSGGQRTALRPGGSSRAAVPRRVSGPLGGRVAAAAAAVALPQRAPVPLPAPRRRPAPVTRPSRRDLPGGARALAWLRALPDHRLLDRLIGGRVWIVLICTLLVGIVTMQLTLLKLNAGIGRAVERGSQLEQRNATLRATISRLSDGDRVIAAARGMGYVVPPQGSPRYRFARASDARAALSVMRVPQAASTTTATATTLAATTVDAAVPPATTTSDPTATADTTTGVTSDPTTATGTTAPVVTAPATTTSGAAGTTTTSGATTTTGTATTGTTVAGGATAPTQ